MLSYAAEVGAAQVVYHALALPEGRGLRAGAGRRGALARRATRASPSGSRSTIAIENLAPLFPGPESLSANPIMLRGLVRRIGSPAITICLDLGHAHIAADLRNTSVELLCEPVLDLVGVFHVHDNLGARRRAVRRRSSASTRCASTCTCPRARDAALGPDRVADQRPSRAR